MGIGSRPAFPGRDPTEMDLVFARDSVGPTGTHA